MYENGNFTSLNIDEVLPNRFQPRIHFDEGKLNELAESIRKYGVIQPIIVRQIGDKYEIIAGERRYKASKIANKSTIPAIVINLNDKESEEIALLENVQRQNLTPIEEAVSYKRILDMGYITQTDLAEKLGKTQSTIANKIRLLNLDDQVQYDLLNGKISERHARSLLRIHDKTKQIEMLNKIINERLTVKKTDDAIKELLEGPKQEKEGGDSLVSSVDNLTVKKPKTPVFVKSEPVEDLFAPSEPIKKSNRAVARGSHEIIRVSLPKDLEEKLIRKDEKAMDIDKIMMEAQDINTPEENKDISELMKQDTANAFVMPESSVEPVVPQPEIQNNDIPLVNDEQNKFVNFNGIIEPEESNNVEPTPIQDTTVSFDSIFNQTPPNLQPVQQSVSQTPIEPVKPVEEPIVNPVNMNSVVSPVNPIPENNALDNLQTESSNSMSIAEAVQKAMNSTVPTVESTPIMESAVNPSPLYNELIESDVVKPVENPEPSMPVQTPVMQQPVVEPASPTVQTIEPPVISNIPDSEIIEEPQNMASNIAPAPVMQESFNNHFIEVIRLIRNCASEIEKLGYFVDVDEVDLEKNYQATFRINKEK